MNTGLKRKDLYEYERRKGRIYMNMRGEKEGFI